MGFAKPTKAQALDLVGVPGSRFEGRVLSRKALGLGLQFGGQGFLDVADVVGPNESNG